MSVQIPVKLNVRETGNRSSKFRACEKALVSDQKELVYG